MSRGGAAGLWPAPPGRAARPGGVIPGHKQKKNIHIKIEIKLYPQTDVAISKYTILINIFLDFMIKSVKFRGRGGKRLGAGRPSTWGTKDIKTIRVPISLADQLLEIARYLNGQSNFRVFHSFEDEESPDFDCPKAMEFSYLHHCAAVLGFEKKQLQKEVDSLKAQLKSAKKQRLRAL